MGETNQDPGVSWLLVFTMETLPAGTIWFFGREPVTPIRALGGDNGRCPQHAQYGGEAALFPTSLTLAHSAFPSAFSPKYQPSDVS